MMVNEEFEFVVNVIMGQNAGSVLHNALRDEGVDNVELLLGLTADNIDSIKFRSPHSPGNTCREVHRKRFEGTPENLQDILLQQAEQRFQYSSCK